MYLKILVQTNVGVICFPAINFYDFAAIDICYNSKRLPHNACIYVFFALCFSEFFFFPFFLCSLLPSAAKNSIEALWHLEVNTDCIVLLIPAYVLSTQEC